MVIWWCGSTVFSAVCVSGLLFHKYQRDATMTGAEIVDTSLQSTTGCMVECDRTPACRAVRLHEESGTCQLLSTEANGGRVVTSWSATENGWEMFVKVS